MALNLGDQTNIDKSNLAAYPNGQIKDDDGSNNGTPINRVTSSDIWMFFDKLMRQAGLAYNSQFDNEVNGYQLIQAVASLASKSDILLPITSSGGVLQIPANLQILQQSEMLMAKAAVDLTTETTIKGTGATPLNINLTNPFFNGDLLLLVQVSGVIQIIVLATADIFSRLGTANQFLKAASNAETLAGVLTSKAVTPGSFLDSFTKLVTIAANAAPYYATTSTPGLLSAADKVIINSFVSNVKNIGWFGPVDPGGGTVGQNLGHSGDITSAVITFVEGTGAYTIVRVTMANAMNVASGHSYFIRRSIQSLGTLATDGNINGDVFQIVSSTQFDWLLKQNGSGVQQLQVNCEAIQI